MTADEATELLSRLNQVRTKAAGIREAIHDGIEQARTINASVRAAQFQLRKLDAEAGELERAHAAHLDEVSREAKRLAAERAAADEAAKAVPAEPENK